MGYPRLKSVLPKDLQISLSGRGVGGELALRSKVTTCTPWRALDGIRNSWRSMSSVEVSQDEEAEEEEEAGDTPTAGKRTGMNGVSQVRQTLKKIQKNLEGPIWYDSFSVPVGLN